MPICMSLAIACRVTHKDKYIFKTGTGRLKVEVHLFSLSRSSMISRLQKLLLDTLIDLKGCFILGYLTNEGSSRTRGLARIGCFDCRRNLVCGGIILQLCFPSMYCMHR